VATSVPGFQPFSGTSAATPSAAAVAALVRSADPSLTVDEVASILTNPVNALDCTSTAGQPDLDCGVGFILADRAVAQAADTTPPVIVGATSPAAPNGKDGWFTGNVGVSWDVSDVFVLSSGGCTPATVAADGVATLTCTATSYGGGSSSSLTVRVDRTKPVKLKFKGIKKTYAQGALPVKSKVKCKAKDPTSGIKSCKVKGVKTTKGTHTLKATAINGAGLKTKATFTYTIT
jgi:subtilisin family serine protease